MKRKKSEKLVESAGNVFLDLGFSPEEAENLRIRSLLMMHLREAIRKRKLTQAAAARHLGVTQPRISDLMRGQVDLFSVDGLIAMLGRAGLHIDIGIRSAA